MNVTRDPDAILASWLDEGPMRLPEATRRAVAVQTRTTRQSRRSLRASWRTHLMNPFARMAAAAIVVVVVIGGTIYALSPGGAVGGRSIASPSPAPTAVPTAAPTAIPSPIT